MLSRHSGGTCQGNKLTRNLPGSARTPSSQLAESPLADPDLKIEINERELISASKTKINKKAQVGNDLSNLPPKSSHARQKPLRHDTTDRNLGTSIETKSYRRDSLK